MTYAELALKIVTLISAIMGLVRAHQERGAGFALAVNQALVAANEQIAAAKDEIENAERIHSTDPTDSAFDQSFKRAD